MLLSAFIALAFFYKTVFGGLFPFPGDLLISEYNPWATHSYLGYNPGSFPSKAQYFDVLRQTYPWKTLVVENIKNGTLPLWNPYNFAGAPLLANFQSTVFSPFNMLFLILPQIFSWTILVLVQPMLAFFFVYLFARKIGLGKIGAVFASAAFSYSLFMSVFIEYSIIGHTILWLPLILYSIEKIREKSAIFSVALLVLALVFSSFGGQLQMFVFIFLFSFTYGMFRISVRRWRVVIFFLLSIGISGIQLLPTGELILQSARVAQAYDFLIEKLLIQPTQLILFLSPDFFGNPATRNFLIPDTYPGNALYIGLIPFIFLFSALSLFKKNPHVRFFAMWAIIMLLLFIRTPISEILYRIEIPFFATASPTNGIFLLSLSLSILAGFGIDRWIKGENRIAAVSAAVVIFTFIATWAYILISHPAVSINNFIYSTIVLAVVIFLLLAQKVFLKRKRFVAVVFIIITIFDLFYFFQKFNPFVPKSLVFPKTEVFSWLSQQGGIDRFWGYGAGSIEPNVGSGFHIFSPDGYDPLYPRRFGEFIQASKDGKIQTTFTNQTRSDAVIASGYGENDLAENSFRLRILDAIGVRYILDKAGSGSTEKTFPIERFNLVYDKDGWRIFENKKAAPRAFLTSDYKIFKTKEEFENIFFSSDFDVTKTILLEDKANTPLRFDDLNHQSKVHVLSYSPNNVVAQTESDSNQLLFLSDTYYPGWKVFIDGVQTKIYRANYVFRAVIVPAGNHSVVFTYQPGSFALGAKITIISVVAAILFALWLSRKKFDNEK